MQPKTTIPNRVRDSSSFFMLPPCSNLVSFVWLNLPDMCTGRDLEFMRNAPFYGSGVSVRGRLSSNWQQPRLMPRPDGVSSRRGKGGSAWSFLPACTRRSLRPEGSSDGGKKSRVHPQGGIQLSHVLGRLDKLAMTAQRVGSAIALSLREQKSAG